MIHKIIYFFIYFLRFTILNKYNYTKYTHITILVLTVDHKIIK